MNKFTLTFLDKAFETLFQNHIQQQYSTMYFSLTFGIIFSVVLLIIQNFLNERQVSQLILIQMILLACLISQLFLVLKYKKLILFAILSTNFIIMTSSIYMMNGDSNIAYFIGQNIMCFHSIVLLILDFKIAAFNNILLLIWRITILFLNIDTIYQPYLPTAIFTQTILMVCLYIKSKAQRELFLLYQKDQNWEKLLPEIVSKPMFIFTFDKENLKFISKLSVPMEFLKDIENPLLHLLRKTQYLGNTLENYIFRKIKSQDSNTIESTEILRVKYQKESKIVKLTKFKLNIITMIITVEDEDLNIQILKKEQQNTAEDWKRTMRQSLMNQIRVMRNLLKTKDKHQLQQILIQYSQLILLQQSKRKYLQIVELTQLLQGIIHEFKMKRIKLITQEPICIQTQRSKMLILLMQITKQLQKQDKLILIELRQIDQSVVMTIKQVQPIQMKYKSQIIQKIQNELIESITYANSQLSIRFYIQPQIPFK